MITLTGTAAHRTRSLDRQCCRGGAHQTCLSEFQPDPDGSRSPRQWARSPSWRHPCRCPRRRRRPAPTISASVDTELTDRFGDYGDTAGSWTGADSAYSVELPDGRTAWIYSDTFLGEVNETHGRPLDSPFIHNSINVDDDGVITTYTGGTPEAPESLVKVAGADEGRDWYWFGDATVHGTSCRSCSSSS